MQFSEHIRLVRRIFDVSPLITLKLPSLQHWGARHNNVSKSHNVFKNVDMRFYNCLFKRLFYHYAVFFTLVAGTRDHYHAQTKFNSHFIAKTERKKTEIKEPRLNIVKQEVVAKFIFPVRCLT